MPPTLDCDAAGPLTARRSSRSFLVAATVLLVATGVRAAPVSTTDPAVFAALTSGVTLGLETFDDFAGTPGPADFGPFTIATSLAPVRNHFARPECAVAPQCVQFAGTIFPVLTDFPVIITFDTPVNAVGFYMNDDPSLLDNIVFSIDGLDVPVIGPEPDTGVFIGFVDLATPFSVIGIRPGGMGNAFPTLDNLSHGRSGAPVPEPAPGALMVMVALGLARRARRR